MAILRRCCCWKNVRGGSFACGIYTMIFYIMVLTGGVFHVHSAISSPIIFFMSLIMIICAGSSVISSVLLLVGLCVDSKILLMPWIVSVTFTTTLDFFLSLYLITEEPLNVFLSILFAIDFTTCVLNVYCLMCVISQYQEYTVGRGRAGQRNQNAPIHYQISYSHSNGRSPKMSVDTTTIVSPTSNNCHLMISSSPTGTFDNRSHPSTEVSFVSEDMSSVGNAHGPLSHRGSLDDPKIKLQYSIRASRAVENKSDPLKTEIKRTAQDISAADGFVNNVSHSETDHLLENMRPSCSKDMFTDIEL